MGGRLLSQLSSTEAVGKLSIRYACLLLRPRLLSWLLGTVGPRGLHEAVIQEKGLEIPVARFNEILHDSVRWEEHGDWCAHAGVSRDPEGFSAISDPKTKYEERMN